MMAYDFDKIIDRKGTDCVKHDGLEHFFSRDDLLPMWVADMDIPAPDFIIKALRDRLDHPVLGYHWPSQSYFDAVIGWLDRRYSIRATREELHFIPGIVAGISFVIQAFTEPGDGILVTTPVYPPFLAIPATSGRRLVKCPLIIKDGRFEMDFDSFEQCAAGCKLLILSNPHNPGGTVWSPDTLRRIAEICAKHGLIVISDEIHADLILPPHHHTSFPTVSSTARDISIMFMAPSKTFNIAGLSSSVSYIHNPEIRKKFHAYLDNYGLAGGNIFAFVGAEAAFRHGEEWLNQLAEYLKNNAEFTRQYLASNMPQVKAVIPEASFLVWLDFSDYGFTHEETLHRIQNVARLALNDGITFGGERYHNCFRLNIGCPHETLATALNRLSNAFEQ